MTAPMMGLLCLQPMMAIGVGAFVAFSLSSNDYYYYVRNGIDNEQSLPHFGLIVNFQNVIRLAFESSEHLFGHESCRFRTLLKLQV